MDKAINVQILREIQEYVKQNPEYYFTLQEVIDDIEKKKYFDVEVEMIDRQIKKFPKSDLVIPSNDFLCCGKGNIKICINTKLIKEYEIKEVSDHDRNNC